LDKVCYAMVVVCRGSLRQTIWQLHQRTTLPTHVCVCDAFNIPVHRNYNVGYYTRLTLRGYICIRYYPEIWQFTLNCLVPCCFKALFKTVVLKHCSESCMQLPGTCCAALSSLSITSLIFCITDFVL